jgi:Fe-S cluster assembly protein SufD
VLPLADLVLPTADEEIWRYSRIDQLEPGSFTASHPRTVVSGGAGATITSERVHDIAESDVFAQYNTEYQATTVIDVPNGAMVAEPIVIDHHTVAGSAAFPRTIVRIGEGAQCTVVERFTSEANAPSLTVPVVAVEAAQGANVSYLAVNDVDTVAWQIGHQILTGHRDSTINISTVTLGGHYTRVRTESRSAGQGASLRQVALYFAAGDQMHDFRVHQDHDAPHTNSDLLFKGAVQDRARSVYTGLISIREHAKGTAANQTNRNLTLSEGAWAESVPNLDIRNNDVRCSHASTVGPIDPEQRFYLESRGLQPEIAERLVVLGFFDEVLSQLPALDLVGELRSRVATRLSIGGTR